MLQRKYRTLTLASAALVASGGLSHALSMGTNLGCDPMVEVDLTWPRHTVCFLDMKATNYSVRDVNCDGILQDDGFDHIGGSGVLIDPCTVLSCGHNFFNRSSSMVACTSPGSDFQFHMAQASDCTVTPAAIRWGLPGSADMLGPLGQFTAAQVGVDDRYTRPWNLRNMRADIGFVRLRDGVWHLRTFMALQTGGLSGAPSDLHVAGYSSAFNAPGDTFSNLRRGTASSPWGDTSFHNYGIDTQSGISGGPQWDSRTNRIVGVHAYDMGILCAGGPRFGGASRSIAEAIFDMDCWSGPTDDDDFHSMSWDELRDLSIQDPDIRIDMNELRLIDGIDNWDQEPTRHVLQIIENTVYEWNEWDLDDSNGSGVPVQMVEMIRPRHEMMSAIDAQALLSASRNWGVKYSHLPPEEIWQKFEKGPTLELDPFEQDFPEPDDSDPNEPAKFTTLEDAPLEGDLNGDGTVGGADLADLLGKWGFQGGTADLNQDGIVDGADLAKLLTNWSG